MTPPTPDDGGPAYPCEPGQQHENGFDTPLFPGMTLRDYFAAELFPKLALKRLNDIATVVGSMMAEASSAASPAEMIEALDGDRADIIEKMEKVNREALEQAAKESYQGADFMLKARQA